MAHADKQKPAVGTGPGANGNGRRGETPAEPEKKTAPSAPRRVLTYVLYGIGGLLGLVLVVVLLVLLVVQTDWGQERVKTLALSQVNGLLEGAELQVGELSGTLLSSLALYDVTLVKDDGEQLAHIDTLAANYRVLPLLQKRLALTNVYLARPHVSMTQQADSTWDLATLVPTDTAAADTAGQQAFTIEVDRFVLHGGRLEAAFYAPERDSVLLAENLGIALSNLVAGEQLAVDLDTAVARIVPPGRAAEPIDLALGGTFAGGSLTLAGLQVTSPYTTMTGHGTLAMPSEANDQGRDLDFILQAQPLAFRDLQPFVPALAPDATVMLDLRVTGADDRVNATMEAQFSDGASMTLTGAMAPPGAAATFYQADGTIRGLDPSFLTGDPAQAGQLNADLDVDLQGPAPEQVDGSATLTLTDTRYGTYALDRTTLESTFTDGMGRFDLQTGLSGMTLALGGTARPFDAAPSYDLSGRLMNLDIGRLAQDGTQSSNLSATFSLAGEGTDPQAATLSAALDLAPSRINTYTIQDGRLQADLQNGTLDFLMRVNAPEGLLAADGALTLGDAAQGEEMSYQIRQGEIRGLDVAALSGDTTRSTINGTFSLDGSGTDPQTMQLAASLDLNDSYYGPYTLDAAGLRADLQSGRLALTGDADLGEGGAVELAASAQPFGAVPVFEVSQMQFRDIDIGALMQNPAQQSNLNGTLTLRAQGTEPQTMQLTTRLDLAASQLNAQPIDAAQVAADLRRGTLQLDTRLDLPEGHVALAGSMQPFSDVPVYAIQEGSFAGIDVGALMGNPALATDLNGAFELEGTGADPETMALDALLRFDRSIINEAIVEAGTVTAGVNDGQARLDARVDVAEGLVQLLATGTLTGEQPRYEAHGSVQDLNLAQLTGADTLAAGFSLAFDVEGQGVEPETMQLQANLLVNETVYGDLQLDTLSTRFRLAEGVVRVDSLVMRSNVAEAQGGGQIALFDTLGTASSDFQVEVAVTSLEPLRAWVAAETFSLRDANLRAAVQGPASGLLVAATAELNSLVYDDLRLAGFEARFNGLLGPDRSLTRADVQTDLNYLSTASIAIRRTQVEASYAGEEAAFAVETMVDERRDARIAGRVDLRPDSRRLFVEDLGLRFDEDQWTLAEAATVAYGDGYRVSNLTLSSGTQQIVVEGVIDPDSLQDFHVAVDGLRLGGVADLVGFEGLGGTLSTTLDLTGPAREPLLTGMLAVDVLHADDPMGNLRLDLDYADRRLNLDGVVTHQAGSTLTLDGYLPFDLSLAPADSAAPEAVADGAPGTADLRVRANAFDLVFLYPFLDAETVSGLQGRLTTDIHIGGAMDAPALDGTFSLAGGRAMLPALGVTYRDIEVQGLLQDNNVVLEQATLRAADGTLSASGRIEMPELTLGQFAIDIDLNDFRAIDSDQYRATVSGALAVSGTTDAPVVAGTLQVRDSDIYLGQTAGGDIREVELTEEDAEMLESFFGYRVGQADTTTSDAYEAMALELDVEMERDTWIRQTANPEMAVELTGRVEVRKQPGEELQLFRSIEVIPERSYIRQFGRRFDIREGEVTFNGPVTELMMDIGAQYEVRSRDNPGEPEAVILLTLAGRLDDLSFTLGSEPPMDNTDIVSYIATGRPASEAITFGGTGSEGTAGADEEGGGLLTAGGGLAANQLAGIVENLAGEELGLDVIEIQQDGLRGTQLIAGKYVAPKVYVGINQPITLSSTENAGAKPTEVTLEYEMFEWLLLQLLSGTSTSSVRLNLMGKYAFD